MTMLRIGSLLLTAVVIASCGAPQASPSPSASARPPSPSTSVSVPPTATVGESPAGSSAPGSSPTASPDGPSEPAGSYTVVPGDTLYSIAARFGVTVEQLQAWNAGRYPSLASDPNTLEAGWVLLVSGEAVPPPVDPTDAPPPPPPSSSGCNAGNRFSVGSQIYATIPGAPNGVALTFDMGGRIEPAVEIMNFLVENGVCATIFPTGVMSQTPEGAEVLEIIRRHPELFEVGNHTMHHCDLRSGGGGSPTTGPCAGGPPSAAFIQQQLADAEQILESASGQSPRPYWRPPYGAYDQRVLDAAAAAGYTQTFMWDIDTIDWKPESEGGPSAAQICGKVVNNAVAGSNVLMHLGGWNTLEALPCMVTGLRERGFVVTSLSDLLG